MEAQNLAYDPAYQYLTEQIPASVFGSTDGLYGGFEPIAEQKSRFTTVTRQKKVGNWLAGYFYYHYNFAKGIAKDADGNPILDNYVDDQQSQKLDTGDQMYTNVNDTSEKLRYRISESNAIKTAYIYSVQSVPILDSSDEEKVFYPISFREEGSDNFDYLSQEAKGELVQQTSSNIKKSVPIQVGERYRGGKKENGTAWYKFESVGVYKSLELISEGEIDGFCDDNRSLKQFNSNVDLSLQKNREEKDDYLQSVKLDNVKVKEINYNSPAPTDIYNFKEFDIDIARNDDGEIGTEDQNLLETQYLFTTNTVEKSKQLYGPRAVNTNQLANTFGANDFDSDNKNYNLSDFVRYNEETYQVIKSLNERIEPGADFNYDENAIDIFFVESDNKFYNINQNINNFSEFYGEYVTDTTKYEQGDLIKSRRPDGSMGYYEMGVDANDLGFLIQARIIAIKAAKILMNNSRRDGEPSTSEMLYRITGDSPKVFDEDTESYSDLTDFSDINSFAVPLTASQEINGYDEPIYTNPVYILKNHNNDDLEPEQSQVSTNIIGDEIFPDTQLQEYFDEVNFENPESILIGTENVSDQYFAKRGAVNIDRTAEEENKESHVIINPLVTEAYVTLGINELYYVYEGDEVKVTYKIGELFEYIINGMIAYHGILAAYYGFTAAKFGLMGAGALKNPMTDLVIAFAIAKENALLALKEAAMANTLGDT